VRVVLSSYYSLNRMLIELSTAFRIRSVNSAVSQTPDCMSLISVLTWGYKFLTFKFRDCESFLHISGIRIHWIGMVGRVLFLWMNVLDGVWVCRVVVDGCVVKYQCETEDGYPRRCSRQAVIARPEWSSL